MDERKLQPGSSAGSQGAPRARWWLPLGILFLLIASNPGRNETLDAEMRRVVARAIWSQGSVSINELPEQSADTWVPAGSGRWVAPYGVGQSLAMVPFDAAGALLESWSPESWRERVGWLPIGLVLLPLLGVLWWKALVSMLEAGGLSRAWAELAATVFFLGTIAFFYAGQPQEECLVGLLLGFSVAAALRARRSGRGRDALLAGALAGAALVTRPVALFALLAVAVLLLPTGRPLALRLRLAALATAGGTVIGLLAPLYNYARFGNPLTIGYDRLGHLDLVSWEPRSLLVAIVLLLGPGVGMLALSPVLVLGAAALPTLWSRDRSYAIGCGVATLACIGFFSGWHDSYTGGTAWGTRYQAHLLTLWVVPVALGLMRWLPRSAAARVLVGVSITIQVASVAATHHLEVYEAACEGRSDLPLQVGLRDGQLGRRLENLARRSLDLGPRPVASPCRQDQRTMWERYVPNFWGPVYARRLPTAPAAAVMAVWLATLILGVTWLALGLRGAWYAARSQPALEPRGATRALAPG